MTDNMSWVKFHRMHHIRKLSCLAFAMKFIYNTFYRENTFNWNKILDKLL